jgi:hypothetical protein
VGSLLAKERRPGAVQRGRVRAVELAEICIDRVETYPSSAACHLSEVLPTSTDNRGMK